MGSWRWPRALFSGRYQAVLVFYYTIAVTKLYVSALNEGPSQTGKGQMAPSGDLISMSRDDLISINGNTGAARSSTFKPRRVTTNKIIQIMFEIVRYAAHFYS